MRKGISITLIIIWTVALSGSALAYERVNPRGPMAIRNQMPLYLFWYSFPQDKADVVGERKLSTSFDYTVSNVVIDKVTTPSEEYIIKADMEISRYNLGVKYGALERLEMGLEIPYLVLGQGYLDTFVQEFEDVIGATSVGARKRTDKYKFNYDVRYQDKSLINSQSPSDGIGDVSLSAKYMLVDETQYWPRASARAAVKFPAASKTKYHGTGEYDYGLGLLLDKSFGRLFTYFNLNTVFIEKPDFLDEWDIKKHIFSGMLGIEYCFTERFSGIVQGTFNSTPYPTTGTDPLDNEAGEVAIGLNYQLTMNSNWHMAVVENCYADSSPDVTFQLGGKIKF
jgi:hypothetical protein